MPRLRDIFHGCPPWSWLLRIGARRPVRVEPDREPDAQLVRQQRDGDEVDGDDGEKCEEHLADEPHKGISF
jgi:hypothetical protein